MNIPNSVKVALAIGYCIGNWALGTWAYGHNAMLCLSDHRTIASQCAIANAQATSVC